VNLLHELVRQVRRDLAAFRELTAIAFAHGRMSRDDLINLRLRE
jgi:hypothetical protein